MWTEGIVDILDEGCGRWSFQAGIKQEVHREGSLMQ